MQKLKGTLSTEKSHFDWKICYLLLLQTTPMITVAERWDKKTRSAFPCAYFGLGPNSIGVSGWLPSIFLSFGSGPVHIWLYIVYRPFRYLACGLLVHCFCGFSHSKRGKNIFFHIGSVAVKLWKCQWGPRHACTRNTKRVTFLRQSSSLKEAKNTSRSVLTGKLLGRHIHTSL